MTQIDEDKRDVTEEKTKPGEVKKNETKPGKPQNQVGHLMLITQPYTIYRAKLYLCELIRHIF